MKSSRITGLNRIIINSEFAPPTRVGKLARPGQREP
jgi:hypothetical protein